MTSPRNQYWRRIVPVVGEPIPDGAEYGNNNAWMYATEGQEFSGDDCDYEWRVPVPVVPVTAAVELVAKLLRHGFRGVFNVNPNALVCMEEFPELVTAQLIELAEQESTNGTH